MSPRVAMSSFLPAPVCALTCTTWMPVKSATNRAVASTAGSSTALPCPALPLRHPAGIGDDVTHSRPAYPNPDGARLGARADQHRQQAERLPLSQAPGVAE